MAGDYAPPPGASLGPVLGARAAGRVPPVYHPFNWRGWVDWGCGAIGDMGAHLIDHPFWALISACPRGSRPSRRRSTGRLYPMATTTYYEFPARGSQAGGEV